MNKHINKNRVKPTQERRYLGVTVTAENYRELMRLAKEAGKNPRHEINYHTRHLEAYLKGQDTFVHGFRRDKKTKKILGPAIFKVRQKWVDIED